jgi:hypothetical protein
MSRTQQAVLVGGSAVVVVAVGTTAYMIVHALVGVAVAISAFAHAFSAAWSM